MGSFDSATFRQVLGHFPTGVTVITAPGDPEPAGLAIGSFFSVSLEPALVGFCVGKTSSTWPAIRDTGVFCANVLGDAQEATCRSFAMKEADRWTTTGWTAADSGSPILNGVLAWIDCDLEATHDGGDHEIVIGRVRNLDVAGDGGPLIFFRGGYAGLTR